MLQQTGPGLSPKTEAAIAGVTKANDEWVERCITEVLQPGIIDGADFTADIVTHAAELLLPQPEDWRCIAGVIRRGLSRGIIEKTGEFRAATYLPPNGNERGDKKPVYRFVR